MTALLASAQEQTKALTDALAAAQTLHAGTLQRLPAQADAADQTEVVDAAADAESPKPEPAPTPEPPKKSLWQRLFGRK